MGQEQGSRGHHLGPVLYPRQEPGVICLPSKAANSLPYKQCYNQVTYEGSAGYFHGHTKSISWLRGPTLEASSFELPAHMVVSALTLHNG